MCVPQSCETVLAQLQSKWDPDLGTAIRSWQSEGEIECGKGGAQWGGVGGGGGGRGGRGGVIQRKSSGELDRGPLKHLVDVIQVHDRQALVGLFLLLHRSVSRSHLTLVDIIQVHDRQARRVHPVQATEGGGEVRTEGAGALQAPDEEEIQVLMWHATFGYWAGVAVTHPSQPSPHPQYPPPSHPAGEGMGKEGGKQERLVVAAGHLTTLTVAACHLTDAVLKLDPSLPLTPLITGGVALPTPASLAEDGWRALDQTDLLRGERDLSRSKRDLQTECWRDFYRSLHSYLANSGVSGVKVDGQAALGLLMPPGALEIFKSVLYSGFI